MSAFFDATDRAARQFLAGYRDRCAPAKAAYGAAIAGMAGDYSPRACAIRSAAKAEYTAAIAAITASVTPTAHTGGGQ